MRMPVIDSTVLTAQTGPPTEYALLNIALYATDVEPRTTAGRTGG